MEMDFWKEIPLSFRIYWIGAILLSLSIIGFVIWVIVKLLAHFGVV